MHSEFFRGRSVFLTGHTGFKGSWLALWLQSAGARVTGFALEPPTNPSLFELAGVANGMRDIRGDVRDAAALSAAMEEAQPELVFHLAAQPLVRASYDTPLETYAVNVMGTAHLLEACRNVPSVRAIVVITTDKVYENREWSWGYREIDPLGGRDPYSSSKACAEIVTAAYRASFFDNGAAVASVRAGNVIGGGDWARDRLVPDVLTSFIARRPVRIRNPHAVRPWQHVLDPLHGYLLLAQRMLEDRTFADAWNFGPSDADARAVGEVVEGLASRWGTDAQIELDRGTHPHEAGLLKLDSARARSLLRWAPRLDLEKALDWSVEWYRCFADRGDVRALTLKQIERYAALS